MNDKGEEARNLM